MPRPAAHQPPPLLRHKLVPPAPGLAVLRRSRLLSRLRESLDHPDQRGTALIAGAGYGKTTLVADFLRESGVEAVWYSLDPSDRDPSIFFRYIIEGIGSRCDDFGRLAGELIEDRTAFSPGPSGVDRFVDVLINDVKETIASRICLVLDDLHHLEGGGIVLDALRRLLTYLPDAVHVILTSRSVPGIDVAHLKAKGRLTVLDHRDLAFSDEESRDLLVNVFGLKLDTSQLTDMRARSQGWVTALQLMRQHAMVSPSDKGKSAGGPARVSPGMDDTLAARTREEIFDYFSEDVYAQESPEVRGFLRRSSLPAILDPEILARVFDDAPVRALLESLLRRNLFIVPLAAQGDCHAYHPLFREFLSRKLLREEGETAVRALHVRYGASHEARGDFTSALPHYVLGGARTPLEDLLIREGPSLVRHGMLDTLRSACASLGDPGALPARIALLRAECERVEGNYMGAVQRFATALEAATDLTPAERASALQGRAYAEMKLGNMENASAQAHEALTLAPADDGALRARILNTLSIVEYRLGRFDEAIRMWKEALALARRAGDRPLLRRVAHNLGLPHGMRGEYDKALSYFRMLLHVEDEGEAALGPDFAIGALNVARIQILLGEFREASTHLDDAMEVSRKFRLEALKGDVLEAQGNLLREMGDRDAARERYAEAGRIFTELGLEDLRDGLEEEEIRLLLTPGVGPEVLRRVEDLRARFSGTDVPVERRASIQELAGEALLLASVKGGGRTAAAIAALETARDLCRGAGFRFQEAEAGLWLARARLAAGQETEAREDAASALELVSLYGYRYMAGRVAADGPLGKLLASMPEGAVTVEAAAGASQLEVSGALGGFDLTINMLGATEVYRDELRRIPASAWTPRKTLRILCYLASARDHRATKDRLVDTFWEDAPPGIIQKNFHPTVSYLRKALNTAHPVKKNFILFESGAYRLNPGYSYRIDVVAFEAAVLGARRKAAAGETAQALADYQEAMRLYRGDYLEEEYDDWIEAPREHYARLFEACLEETGALHAAAARWEEALGCYERLVQRDPYSEPGSCRVMEALGRLGNRLGVQQEFQRLTATLEKELDLPPLPETRAVYERSLEGKGTSTEDRPPARRFRRPAGGGL